jgi:hypothetical protein
MVKVTIGSGDDLWAGQRANRPPLRGRMISRPGGVTDLDQFRVQRRDCAGGVIHEYRLVA